MKKLKNQKTEIGIGFESYTIQNLFFTNIIDLKPDIVIGGFPQ